MPQYDKEIEDLQNDQKEMRKYLFGHGNDAGLRGTLLLMESRLKTIEKCIKDLKEGRKWLFRLVVGALCLVLIKDWIPLLIKLSGE